MCGSASKAGRRLDDGAGNRLARKRAGSLVGVIIGSAVAASALSSSASVAQSLAGCSIFPTDSIWNARVDSLPLDPNSALYVDTIGADGGLHPDFGAGDWPPGSGAPIGIPYVIVPGNQPGVPVEFLWPGESDPGPYPVPPDAPIEGGPASNGDRHVLVMDSASCVLYELFYAFPRSGGASWDANSGAAFDLTSYDLRPETWTSADAAGLPILPGLVRYEEVAAGRIEHALRFTVPETRRAFVWPARHFASSLTHARHPPMGQRFRLRSDFDAAGFSPAVQVILQALKEYGMMLADNGSAWFISGAPDERWDNDELAELSAVRGSDFEAVDVSGLIVDADSSRTAPAVECTAPDNLVVSDLSITNRQVFRACEEIIVGPNVAVYGPDGIAFFSAGDRIVLGSGTTIHTDARLEVVTGHPLVVD